MTPTIAEAREATAHRARQIRTHASVWRSRSTDTTRASIAIVQRTIFIVVVVGIAVAAAWRISGGSGASEGPDVRWTQIGTPPLVYDWRMAPQLLYTGERRARRIEVLDWGLVEGRGIAALPSYHSRPGCTDLIVADAWEALYRFSVPRPRSTQDSSKCSNLERPAKIPSTTVCPSGVCAAVDHRGVAFIGDATAGRVLVADAHQSRLSIRNADPKAGDTGDGPNRISLDDGVTAVAAASRDEWFVTVVPPPPPSGQNDAAKQPAGKLLAVMRSSDKPTTIDEMLQRPVGVAYSPHDRRIYVADVTAQRTVWLFYEQNAAKSWVRAGVFASEAADRGPTLPVLQGIAVAGCRSATAALPAGGGEVFAAGPGGLYLFTAEGRLIARYVLSERISGLSWGDDNILYMTIGHKLARLQTKVPGANLVSKVPDSKLDATCGSPG